jgi:hypothetical protein
MFIDESGGAGPGVRLRKPHARALRTRTADLKEAKVLLKKLTRGGRNHDLLMGAMLAGSA